MGTDRIKCISDSASTSSRASSTIQPLHYVSVCSRSLGGGLDDLADRRWRSGEAQGSTSWGSSEACCAAGDGVEASRLR